MNDPVTGRTVPPLADCTREGGGHRPPTDRPRGRRCLEVGEVAHVLAVSPDGAVFVVTANGVETWWHHHPRRLHRAADEATQQGRPVRFDADRRLLLIGLEVFSLAAEAGPICPDGDLRAAPRRRVRTEQPASGTPGHRRFDVPWGPAGGAETMTVALTRHLAELHHISEHHGRQVLVVSILGDGNRFTQALVEGDHGVFVEAVSNDFLATGFELDETAMAVLDAFGYHRPAGEGEQRWPNHHATFEPPLGWADAARMLVLPLAVVYGVGADDIVRVRSFPA